MEYPEIKVVCRYISRHFLNRKIVDFSCSVLTGDSSKVKGHRIKKVEFFGQKIIFKLDSGYYLFINIRSTGELVFFNKKNIKAEFVFEGEKKIFLVDVRPYSYVVILNDKEHNKRIRVLGVDPLSDSFCYDMFLKMIKRRSASIKSFLTDSSVLIGVGKVYADEICFEARVRPDKRIKKLRDSEKKRLYTATGKILRKSIIHGGLGGDFNRFIRVYDRENLKCARCSGTVEKLRFEDLSAYCCVMCQK